jgi:hypothetical protein
MCQDLPVEVATANESFSAKAAIFTLNQPCPLCNTNYSLATDSVERVFTSLK